MGAFSLTAAPLFTALAPSKIPHTSPQMPDANPALRGTLSSAGAGTPSLMKVASGGGVALAVAGMGQRRQRMSRRRRRHRLLSILRNRLEPWLLWVILTQLDFRRWVTRKDSTICEPRRSSMAGWQ